MAINPESQYPGQIAPSSADYPYGQARNITVPGDGTGTPWEAALVNDLFGWQQELLTKAAIVPTGDPEKVGASQYAQAMDRLLKRDYATLTGSTVVASMAADVANDRYVPVLGDVRRANQFSSVSKKYPQPWEVVETNVTAPAATEIETINSRKVWLVDGELYIEKSAGGNCYKWRPVLAGVLHLAIYGAVFDAATSSSDALDQAIEFGWNNYTERLIILGDDGLVLSKAGDHVFPPNAVFACTVKGGGLWFGNQLTRLYFKRDNTRVDPAYQPDGAYWGLGPNGILNWTGEVLDAVSAVDNCIYVSDLIQFFTRDVAFGNSKVDIQLHLQNDSKWTEFWDVHGEFNTGGTAAIKFSKKSGGTGTVSFGHGRYDGRLSSRKDGGAAVLIADGASPYNSQWKTQGFVAAPTGGQIAALFWLTNGGILRYADFDCTIENLGNNGTPYGIYNDGTGGSGVVHSSGLFHGIGAETKFRGIGYQNNIRVVGGKLLGLSGNDVFQGNEMFKIITGSSDINGDNLLRLLHEKVFSLFQSAPAADAVAGILPIANNRARISSIQLFAGTAGAGNTGSATRELDISTITGVFEVGETVTGGTSGATGTVSFINAADGIIVIKSITGTFVAAETVTGGTSGATATVDAVAGVWHLGIRKQGSTTPSAAVTIADGKTVGYQDVYFDVPSTWNDLPANQLVWRSEDGSGNDGTAPQDVHALVSWYEI